MKNLNLEEKRIIDNGNCADLGENNGISYKNNNKKIAKIIIASKTIHIFANYDNNNNAYMNLFRDNKNKKRSQNVTRMVSKFFTDYDDYNGGTYINLSVYNNKAEDGAVTGMVSELPDEQCLHRFPGLIPGRTASAFLEKINIILMRGNYFLN